MDSKDIQQEFFGFIGTGGALARALRKQVPGSRILLSNRTSEKSRLLAGELNAVQSNNDAVARSARYIFLGVKPQMAETLLSEIAPVLAGRQDRFLLVTMAAGLTCRRILAMAGRLSRHPHYAQHPRFRGGRDDPIFLQPGCGGEGNADISGKLRRRRAVLPPS